MKDIVFIMVMLAIFSLLCNSIYISTTKVELYAECITTDYDKFQCYSMIYGGK